MGGNHLHATNVELSSEIAGIQSADGQTHSVAGHDGWTVVALHLLIHQRQWGLRRGIQVGPDPGHATPFDASPFI